MSCKELPHHHSHTHEAAKLAVQLGRSEDFQGVSEIFKQLADTSRVRIFWALCHCEECVMNLSALVDMSSPAVSHHLRQLKASGLVVSRREGKEVYYKAADSEAAHLLHDGIERIMAITCPDREFPRIEYGE